MPERKKVAAVVTEYRHWSHADVIVGKLIEGYLHDGKEMPSLQVASLFTDQKPKNDMAPALAKKHGFTIHPTIADALTLGGKKLAVDAVLCIGEHGDYPTNKRGQILYPRRRFLEEVAKVFAASKKSVPVFSDKHLGPQWDDAKWMFEKAKELHFPLMAGSSVPVTWRRPELKVPIGTVVEGAVQVGYGPMEGYGFHAMEGLQCIVERRKGGETGVKSVQAFQGKAMWDALDALPHGKACLEAAMKGVIAHAKGDVRAITMKDKDAALLAVEYADGFKAGVAMLNGWVHEAEGDGGGFHVACKLAGKVGPSPCQFFLQQPDPFAHFIHLVKAIERMVQANHTPWPVERTLLTSGVIDAAMTSLADRGRKVDTPHLAIRYKAVDYPFATGSIPKAVKRERPR
jgi:hypothetical protein